MVNEIIINDISKKFNLTVLHTQQLTGGHLNLKYWLQTDQGEFLLKIYSKKRYDEKKLAIVENGLYRQYELHKRGFICPKLYTHNNTIIQHISNYSYMLMEYIKGELKSYINILNTEMQHLGEVTGLMHNLFNQFPIAGESFNVAENLSSNKIKNAVLMKNLNHIDNVELKRLLSLQNIIFNNTTIDFLNSVPISFSHADYASDNIMFYSNRVSGVIDFDRCRYTTIWQDIGRVLISYCLKNNEFNYDYLRDFVKGYNKFNSLTYSNAINSLKYIFIHESTWWLTPEFVGKSQSLKVQRFISEMAYLAENYNNLEAI